MYILQIVAFRGIFFPKSFTEHNNNIFRRSKAWLLFEVQLFRGSRIIKIFRNPSRITILAFLLSQKHCHYLGFGNFLKCHYSDEL